jgi:N-acetyl-anhydromuramyl-L-alanine amidase AmpD
MVVTKDRHVLTKGSGTRKLAEITGATLHQTACVLGENEDRWKGVACHFGITRSGKIIYNTDLIKKVWHGNGFNSKTIGIEIDGHFAGLETLDAEGNWNPVLSSYWRPKSAPNRMPLSITDAQVEACKELIRWLKRLIDAAGGNFEFILAHRQSSASRVSDPGEKTWKLVAVPLLEELNMSDGGDDYYILDSKGKAGKPIPSNWDRKRHAKVSYKPKTSTIGRKRTGP